MDFKNRCDVARETREAAGMFLLTPEQRELVAGLSRSRQALVAQFMGILWLTRDDARDAVSSVPFGLLKGDTSDFYSFLDAVHRLARR